MRRHIEITDANANIIPLRVTLQNSIERADEIDLAAMLSSCGSEIDALGEGIRLATFTGAKPPQFLLAGVLALLHSAERAVCVYAVSRGLETP